jgi:hypothetical protein
LRETYDDLLQAAAGADLMIAGELNYAAPLVSEKLGLRWVSAILSPASFFSAHDPSVMVNVPWLMHVRKAGWRAYRAVFNLGRLGTQAVVGAGAKAAARRGTSARLRSVVPG